MYVPARLHLLRAPLRRFVLVALLGASSLAGNAALAADEGVVPQPVEIPASLSMDQALTTFRAKGFQLLIAEAAVRSAEGDEHIAGAVPNPILSGGYGHAFNYSASFANSQTQGGGASTEQFSVGVSDNAAIEDTLAGKRDLRLKVARAALAAAKLARTDAQRVLELQVKTAYLQVALAAESLDFTKEVQKTNQSTLDLNQRRYDKGAINEGDLARVRTAKLEADQAVDTAAENLRQARVALAFLLGVRGKVPDFDIDRNVLKYRIPAALASSSPDTLLRSAFDHRPDLRALGYQRERAQASISLAKRQVFPDIALSVNYTQTGTNQAAIQPPTLSVGLSAPIPVFYQQKGEIRKAEADYDTQSLAQAQTTAQVVSDVETGYAAFGTSKLLVQRMEGTLLDSAKTARDITQKQFVGGTATLMDYLDAQRTYIAANLEYLQDLTNYWTSVYQLEAAVGTELRQ